MDRGSANGSVNRAQRFEDEKRRIIESCFSRKDADGTLQETYITHLRITEFSNYPSSPPPPQSRTPETQKPRVIIVAVRRSGRVCMHKSKENSNGSFSVGKTWNFDDISHIQSYSGPNADPTQKLWAGDTGFLITIQKPYYWQAQTDKEKKFFIASLVKIYGKYTGGRTPELSGFDPRELDMILGTGRRTGTSPGPQRPPSAPRGNPPLPSSHSQEQMPPTMTNNYGRPSMDRGIVGPKPPITPVGSAPGSAASSPFVPPPPRLSTGPMRNSQNNLANSPSGSIDSNRAPFNTPSNMRRLTPTTQSQDSPIMPRNEDGSNFRPRSRGRASQNSGGGAYAMDRSPSHNGNGVAAAAAAVGAAIGASAGATSSVATMGTSSSSSNMRHFQDNSPEPLKSSALEAPPPERKRPPLDSGWPNVVENDLVPAPLMSPKQRDPVPPPRNMDRMSTRNTSAGYRSETGSIGDRQQNDSIDSTLTGSHRGPPSTMASPAPSTSSQPSKPPLAATAPAPELETTPNEDPEALNKPGLGPMIKSKRLDDSASSPASDTEEKPGLKSMIKAKSKPDLAGSLWKAAAAAGAFKPRPGGAGERLRQAALKSMEGPDGINAVVPAPPRPDPPKIEPEPEKPPVPANPSVSVTPPDAIATVPAKAEEAPPPVPKKDEQPPKEESKRSIMVGNDAKLLTSMGIDPSVLDDTRSADFSKWLDYVGFIPGQKMRSNGWDAMKMIEREIDKAQAGGWLSRIREEDERISDVRQGIDLVISECDELENLLTLYSVELGTISDDIAYIENQSQGLQVQAANQKALKKELELILDTCSISSRHLDVLKVENFDARGLKSIEDALIILYKAMVRIDSNVHKYEPSKGDETSSAKNNAMNDPIQGNTLNSSYGQMRIVQEKKEYYLQESVAIMRRYVGWMAIEYEAAFAETHKALDKALARKTDRELYQTHRSYLWGYCALNLYARDVHTEQWNELIQNYQARSHELFRAEFTSVIDSHKSNARKTLMNDDEILFTTQPEKHHDNIAATARKLTVKRSQTLARTFRSDASKAPPLPKANTDSRDHPFEIFRTVLYDFVPLIEMEQNFFIDFFHATIMETADFNEFIASRPSNNVPPEGKWSASRRMEPDRELGRKVTKSMEAIFSFLEKGLQRMIEWVLSTNPLQGVGVLAALEQKMELLSGSNQDYLNILLQKLHSSLESRFEKFVDEQIRAIEETKVKFAKKRRGVIHFFKVFPPFFTAVENILSVFYPQTRIRDTINREYGRILRAMFDALRVIARENKGVGVSNNTADPEDKEALNYHILLIENFDYFIEEIGESSIDIIEDKKREASGEYAKHLDLYLNAVMRRPLGKLLDYLENVEAQLQALKAAEKIALQPSNSKAVFNKILSSYDAKEVRKGIELLRKRVEKHFGESEEKEAYSGSRELVEKVTGECEKFYGKVELRIASITAEVYGGDVLFEWPRSDVKNAFSG
ncbi:Exocyst complex component 1, partial [Ceratocystis fimbriata CBS 114723]